MLQIEQPRRVVRQWSDLWELSQWLKATPRRWRGEGSREKSKSDSWDLNAGYAGSEHAMVHGWPEGLESIAAEVASIPSAAVYEREYGFAGELPDVPRYLSGDPRNMIHRGKAHKPTQVMTLAVNIACSGATSASAMRLFGAAMAAIVDRLEARHVRVELIACWIGSYNGGDFSYSWTVKKAEDPLDLNAVAFSLGHPGCLRRIGFAIHERTDRWWENSGYGIPRDVPTRKDFVDLPEDALLIGGIGRNGGNSKCRTVVDAMAFVEEQINAAAGEPIASLEAL